MKNYSTTKAVISDTSTFSSVSTWLASRYSRLDEGVRAVAPMIPKEIRNAHATTALRRAEAEVRRGKDLMIVSFSGYSFIVSLSST